MKGLKIQERQKVEQELAPIPRAFYDALLGTGARISELLLVKRADIEAKAVSLVTLKKKDNSRPRRRVPIDSKTHEALIRVVDYLEAHPKLHRSTVNRWFAEAGFHPHQLRHTYAETQVLNEALQHHLGHAKISQTAWYHSRSLLVAALRRVEVAAFKFLRWLQI